MDRKSPTLYVRSDRGGFLHVIMVTRHSRAVIAELQQERRSGNVSSETEQHLKHKFRALGQDASSSALSAAVGSEIDRLSREAETLGKLRVALFGAA